MNFTEKNYKKFKSKERGLLNFPGTLMRVGLKLMKNVLPPLAKTVLIPLVLTAAKKRKISWRIKSIGRRC